MKIRNSEKDDAYQLASGNSTMEIHDYGDYQFSDYMYSKVSETNIGFNGKIFRKF